MTHFTLITWTLAVIAACGSIMCIKKHRACFYCWMVSDAGWAIVDFSRGIYAQMALYLFFLALSIVGAWAWRKEVSNMGSLRNR